MASKEGQVSTATPLERGTVSWISRPRLERSNFLFPQESATLRGPEIESYGGMHMNRESGRSAASAIRVMIVETHAIVRQGLRTLIGSQRDMEIVAETGDGGEAIALYASSRPDVVLMDLRLRTGSGLDVIRELRSAFEDCRIVVLSTYSNEEHVYRAVAAGAYGYVIKDEDPSHITRALRAVRTGQHYLSPEASARLAEHVHRSPLTKREEEVLTLLVQGRKNREIADALGIVEETVKGHVKNILSKLGVRDRAQATSEAIRRGLVLVD